MKMLGIQGPYTESRFNSLNRFELGKMAQHLGLFSFPHDNSLLSIRDRIAHCLSLSEQKKLNEDYEADERQRRAETRKEAREDTDAAFVENDEVCPKLEALFTWLEVPGKPDTATLAKCDMFDLGKICSFFFLTDVSRRDKACRAISQALKTTSLDQIQNHTPSAESNEGRLFLLLVLYLVFSQRKEIALACFTC